MKLVSSQQKMTYFEAGRFVIISKKYKVSIFVKIKK
jgi:hypothetical protein